MKPFLFPLTLALFLIKMLPEFQDSLGTMTVELNELFRYFDCVKQITFAH